MYNSQVFQETFRMSVAFNREDVAYGKPHKGQKSTIVTAVAQFSNVALMLFGKSLFFQDWKVASLTKYLEGRYPGMDEVKIGNRGWFWDPTVIGIVRWEEWWTGAFFIHILAQTSGGQFSIGTAWCHGFWRAQYGGWVNTWTLSSSFSQKFIYIRKNYIIYDQDRKINMNQCFLYCNIQNENNNKNHTGY